MYWGYRNALEGYEGALRCGAAWGIGGTSGGGGALGFRGTRKGGYTGRYRAALGGGGALGRYGGALLWWVWRG